jgi:hypothetical protein
MRKSKLFLTIGGLILALCAIFAARVSYKFVRVCTACTPDGYEVIKIFDCDNSFFTTANPSGSLSQVALGISRKFHRDLVTCKGFKVKVYYVER